MRLAFGLIFGTILGLFLLAFGFSVAVAAIPPAVFAGLAVVAE